MIDITSKASIQQRIDRLCYLFLIFLIGCLAGWFYEEIFYWITEGLLGNRGLLYGPWLPIYGIGALGIYAMKPMKKHPTLLFLLLKSKVQPYMTTGPGSPPDPSIYYRTLFQWSKTIVLLFSFGCISDLYYFSGYISTAGFI